MKTEKQIKIKIKEVKSALEVSENTYEHIAWKCSLNALQWVLDNE